MTTQIALPALAKAELETALELYRKANTDLDSAINAGAWGQISGLQGRRDLQAHTIALIINKSTLSLVGEGVPA